VFIALHAKNSAQLVIGFLIGVVFGFLLHKGGVTQYNVIINQLLLKDFTVVKVMLSAIVTGMISIHLLRIIGLATLHPKSGSFGSTVIGGLIFGIGFGILGYCPGTLAGAVGQGSLDALFGGIAGMLIGTGLFSALYLRLDTHLLNRGSFGDITMPELLKVNAWLIILPVSLGIIALLLVLEQYGM
jgi:hypothetical protein